MGGDHKLKNEGEFGDCSKSDDEMSISTSSSSVEYHQELKKKPKKLRSIKLTKMPSLSSRATSTTRLKYQSASGYAASSEHSTPVDFLDSSMNAESCSDTKETFQGKKSAMILRRSSFRSVKSIARLPSTKYRMRKSSGETVLKKSRSIKSAKSRSSTRKAGLHYEQHSAESYNDAGTSSNHLQPMSSYNENNVDSQVSPRVSESSVGSNHSKDSNASVPNVASAGDQSMKGLVRTTSLKPFRIFTKRASFKSKRPFSTRGSKVSRFQSPTVGKATCSSTLKDSKYLKNVQPEGGESSLSSTMKVCTYSYCSLHGHRHGDVPPLKRFVSMRRRLLKCQKNVKPEGQVLENARRNNITKRGVQRQQKVDNAVEEKASSITEVRSRDSFIKIYDGSKGKADGVHVSSGGSTRKMKKLSAATVDDASCLVVGDSGVENQYTINREICVESCSAPANADETNCAAAPEGEEQGVFVSNTDNGDDLLVTEDHCELNDVSRPELRTPNECDNWSLKHNHILNTSDMDVPMHGLAQRRSNEDTVSRLKLEKPKNFRLWNLIYQQMVTGLAAEPENQSSLDGVNKEEHGSTLRGASNYGTSQDYSEADQKTDGKFDDDGIQKLELYKNDAIKLVKEAFDRILSEIPDHSSDNQSVTSETTSYPGFFKDNQGGEELSISNYDSVDDSVTQDQGADNFSISKEEKAASMEGSESNQQSFKSWNSLKRILTLKRFVKALQQVKNINYREPRYLAREHKTEAEKVLLKQWTSGGKINSEEWMLDYALRQVISSLAPVQKRKVSLLVHAFETVMPLPGLETHRPLASSQETCSQTQAESSDLSVTETSRENNFAVKLSQRSYPEISSKGSEDQAGGLIRMERKVRANNDQCEETSLASSCSRTALGTLVSNPKDANQTIRHDQCVIDEFFSPKLEEPKTSEKVPQNGKIFREVPSQETMVSDSKVHEGDPELCSETNLSNSFQDFSADGHNQPRSSEHAVSDSSLEKQKSFTLWHLIYQHIKTSIDGEAESRSSIDRLGKDIEEDAPTLIRTNVSSPSDHQHEANQNKDTEDYDDNSQQVELYKTNAIKLVREAFDKILSEIPDNSSDNQSTTSEKMSYPEFLEEERGGSEETSISRSGFSSEMQVENPEGMQLKTDNFGSFKEKAVSAEENNDKKSLKGWSNLKKIIVLKRFVKALGNVRNMSPQKPQDLAMEAEKVHLKHQMTNEKKYGEKWMLDYALRQVISTLAPVQKRKVALLVQAFETVIPPHQRDDDLTPDSCSSYQATKAQASVESLPETAGRTQGESSFGILLRRISKLEIGAQTPEICDQVKETYSGNDCNETALGTSITCSIDVSFNQESIATSSLHDDGSMFSLNPDDSMTSNYEKFPANEKIFHEVPSQETMVSDSKICESDPQSCLETNLSNSCVDFSADGHNQPRSNEHAVSDSSLEKQKSFTLWHLIYQRMKTSIDAEAESRSSVDRLGKDLEEDAPTSRRTDVSRPSNHQYEVNQNMNVEDYDDNSQQVELYKTNAIKLVREAFDKILSEIPDNSSDNQSATSETMSYREFLEEECGDGEDISISRSGSSSDMQVKDPEGMQLKTDNFGSFKEEKEVSTEENNNKKSLNGWSNLKKLIVLKRFVKALGNVRNISPQKPQDLTMEAEKVHLKRQTTNAKKYGEEWMLDYALRQVISTLAPVQKRKVALLVQAFETVIPPHQSEKDPRPNSCSSSQAIKAQASVESLQKTAGRTQRDSSFGILLCRISKLDIGDQAPEICDETALDTSVTCSTDASFNQESIAASSLHDGGNMPSLNPDNSMTRNYATFPANDKILHEVPMRQTTVPDSEEIIFPDSEVQDGDPVFNPEKSDSDMEQSERSQPAAVEAKIENGGLHRLPLPEESQTACSEGGAQLGKQSHMKLWYLVYKHMASSSEVEDGNQRLLEGEGDGTDKNIKNKNVLPESLELHHIEAIRMVEEAIDEIPLADVQYDQSDIQSVASDQIPDDSGPTSVDSANNNSFRKAHPTMAEHRTEEDPKEITAKENNPRPKAQKGWSNLKKMILLKRFLKALEKVKGPQNLPSNHDPDPEKVNLRHQDTMERRNSEEWMLDYALQRVVSTMTPARKRKVALLVEAFESVSPSN